MSRRRRRPRVSVRPTQGRRSDEWLPDTHRAASRAWECRQVMLRSRIHGLSELLELDAELQRNLTALLEARARGICVPQARDWTLEPGKVFVEAVCAGMRGRDTIEAVVSEARSPSVQTALMAAMAWLPLRRVAPCVKDWHGYQNGRWRALALAAQVAHRSDPGLLVDRGLADSDLSVRILAARACGVFRRRDLTAALFASVAMDPNSASMRFASEASLLSLGEPEAPQRLLGQAARGGPHAELCAELALRRMPVGDALTRLDILSRHPGTDRCVVLGAAATGSSRAIPLLLEAMHDPELSALAAYGLSTITGLELEEIGLRVGFSRSEADPELPFPDVMGVDRWWRRHRYGFEGDQRWCFGRERSPETLCDVLRAECQHQRLLAAYDLHRAFPCGLFETTAPARRQRRALARLYPT